MSEERIYLNCPFDDKEECKELGGRWDGDEKKWYITSRWIANLSFKWIEDRGKSENADQGDIAKKRHTWIVLSKTKRNANRSGAKWDGDAKMVCP